MASETVVSWYSICVSIMYYAAIIIFSDTETSEACFRFLRVMWCDDFLCIRFWHRTNRWHQFLFRVICNGWLVAFRTVYCWPIGLLCIKMLYYYTLQCLVACDALLSVGDDKRYVCYLCNSTLNSGCGPVFNKSSVTQFWCEAGQVCLKTTTRVVNGRKFSHSPYSSVCSLAVLDPRLATPWTYFLHFVSVLCRSDWLFHGESCPRIDVVHPDRAWSSSPACTWHSSLHYLFLPASPLFLHDVTIVCELPCFNNV